MKRAAGFHGRDDGIGPFKKFLKKDFAAIYDKQQALEFIEEISRVEYLATEIVRNLGSPAGLHAIELCLSLIVVDGYTSATDWKMLNKLFILIANKKFWEGLLKHEIEKISATLFGIKAFWLSLSKVIGTDLCETESISLILCLSECRGIISSSSLSHPEIAMLLETLKRMLPSLSIDEVYALLEQWQQTQNEVKLAEEEQLREEEQARLMQRDTLVPIWRCAVCGRADQPYIACYVQPYIVRYERRPVT